MNKQNKIIVGVVALILALTIGYAVFSQSLNINGTAKAEGKLDIIFSEVGEIVSEGANRPTTTITEEGRKLELGDISLDYPTAYVEVPVTIVNNGTVDGVLEGITVENLEADDIKVTIKDIAENQVIKMYNVNDETTKVKATIRVEWLDKADTKTESIKNISITLNAKQLVKEVVTTKDSSTSKCTEFTKKDTYNVGDMISFCNTDTGKSEDFYVIKDNGDSVTALAKYNLMVGNMVNISEGSITPIPTDTKDYGLQSDKTLIEYDSNFNLINNIQYGTLAFASENEEHKNSNGDYLGYWSDSDGNLLSKYGSSYPADVYGENSLLWEPVQNYVSYIKNTIGKSSISGTLITRKQLIDLGCSAEDGTCSSAPDWLKTNLVSWSASALNYKDISIYSSVGFDGEIRFHEKCLDNGMPYGVRPVITINKSEI